MKLKIYLIGAFIVFASNFTFAQVGIGTTTPQAALEVSSTTSGILIPRMTVAQRDLIPVPLDGMLVYVTNGANPGFFYYDNNTTAWVNTIGPDDQDSSEVTYDNLASGLTATTAQDAIDELNSGKGQVEEITEGGSTGYRIRDKDPTEHVDIGTHAIDFANADDGSHANVGATGNNSLAVGKYAYAEGHGSIALGEETDAIGRYSIAMGRSNESSGFNSAVVGGENNTVNAVARFGAIVGGNENTVSGERAATLGGYRLEAPSKSEVALGEYNTTYTISTGGDTTFNPTDRVLSVGIGTGVAARADALEVFKDGTIYADELDIAEITSNKQIVTKEYVDNNISSSGGNLELVTEAAISGFRIKNRNAANYGDTGTEAVDLSMSNTTSTTRGATGNYAFTSGLNTTASGENSTAMGSGSVASGNTSMATGQNTTASALAASAFGDGTIASGTQSFASGFFTTASGIQSFATGNGATASAPRAFAAGNGVTASGNQSVATGSFTTASGGQSFATGNGTTASGEQTFAIGTSTNANSYSEVAMGHFNTNVTAASTNGVNTTDRVLSIGIGTGTGARADGLEVFKDGTIYADELDVTEITGNKQLVTKEYVDANSSGGVLEEITEGTNTGYRINGSTNAANYGDIGAFAVDLSRSTGASSSRGATGLNAFASGVNLTASGDYSFAGGLGTTASGNYSIAMGSLSLASGVFSMAIGQSVTASNDLAIAFSDNTTASGRASFATGSSTTASGDSSFAGGNNTFAFGDQSFTFGNGVSATGNQSFATGFAVTASAPRAFASGFSTAARGSQSFAMGEGTNANSYGEVAMGSFNTNLTAVSANGFNTTDRVLSVGIGINAAGSADALEVFKDGTIYADELDIAEITGIKQLVTKEYVDANTGYLEQITEGANTGYRINGKDANNYGDIGSNATDLSQSITPSTTLGATGNFSFASGFENTVSGSSSVAFGSGNTASGNTSFAGGSDCVASANRAFAFGINSNASAARTVALGNGLEANSFSETALGMFNNNTTAVSTTAFNAEDKLLSVGNGTSSLNRSEAFTIFKNGAVQLHPVTEASITAPQEGMIIIDSATATNELKIYINGSWQTFFTPAP